MVSNRRKIFLSFFQVTKYKPWPGLGILWSPRGLVDTWQDLAVCVGIMCILESDTVKTQEADSPASRPSLFLVQSGPEPPWPCRPPAFPGQPYVAVTPLLYDISHCQMQILQWTAWILNWLLLQARKHTQSSSQAFKHGNMSFCSAVSSVCIFSSSLRDYFSSLLSALFSVWDPLHLCFLSSITFMGLHPFSLLSMFTILNQYSLLE